MIRRRAKGLSLIEVMITLVILAALMTAVAAAMQASMQSHSEDQKIATAAQAARFALDRLCRDVRTANDVDNAGGTTAMRLVPPADGSGTTIIQYTYEAATHRLLCQKLVNGTPQVSVLLGGDDGVSITAFRLSYVSGQDWQGFGCTKSVTVHVTYTVGGQSFTATASAAPRRNLLY